MCYYKYGQKRKGKRNLNQSKEYRKCQKYLDRVDNLINFVGSPESLLEHSWTLNPNWIVPYSDKKISTWKNIKQASDVLRNRILLDKRREKEKFRVYAYEDEVPYFSMLYIFIKKCFPTSVQTALNLAKHFLPYSVRRDEDTVYIFDISTNTQYIETSGKEQIKKKGLPYLTIEGYYLFKDFPNNDIEENGYIYTEAIENFFIEKESDKEDSYRLYVYITKYRVDEEDIVIQEDENGYNSCFIKTLSGKDVAYWVQKIMTNKNVSETKLFLEQNGFDASLN